MVKRIADPIYDVITLNELETEIINTKVFQRLNHIRHLGLAYFIFPNVNYPRFAHSLGVCHVTGLLLDSIVKGNIVIPADEQLKYRLAALLHDIGHYPYSHAMEKAIEDFYSATYLKSTAQEDTHKHFKHERVGKEVLLKDAEINAVLKKHGIESEEIFSIFMRERPQKKFANLISSDLDADRIDYLLRTAHHTGLPYGSVDLSYLLSRIAVDKDLKICLNSKALRTADHFLLCRYFDYQQVTHHKTLVGLELVLRDVIHELLKENYFTCSAADISKRISEVDGLNLMISTY